RRLQQRCYGCGAARSHEHVGCGCDQFGRVPLNVAAIRPACIDPQVAALAPSQLAERLCERGVPGLSLGVVCGEIREHADAPHPLALLRVRRERPAGRSTAKQRDERAAVHSITSSARASSIGEISRPRALAVMRLRTNSNLVGCSTGMSPGFAPRRILSTSSAARRNMPGTFGPYDIRPPSSTFSRSPKIVGSRALSAKVTM